MARFIRVRKLFLAVDRIIAIQVVGTDEYCIHVDGYEGDDHILITRSEAAQLISYLEESHPIFRIQ